MALSKSKRAQKIARKQKKRKEVLNARKQEQNKYLTISDASLIPVYSCYITENWQEIGMAAIFIIRKRSDTRFIMTHIILDTYCLGVKNCYNRNCNLEEKEYCLTKHESLTIAQPEYVKKLIVECIKFAGQLGFAPHIDYLNIKQYVNNLPDTQKEYNFQFGDKDGKPLYIQGPNDDDDFVFEVMKKLQNSKVEYNYKILAKSHF